MLQLLPQAATLVRSRWQLRPTSLVCEPLFSVSSLLEQNELSNYSTLNLGANKRNHRTLLFQYQLLFLLFN
jgi:hypothetical protein